MSVAWNADVFVGGVVPSRLVFGVWSRVVARVCSDGVVPVGVFVDGVGGGFEFRGGGFGLVDPGGCSDVVFYVKGLEKGRVPAGLRLRVLNPLLDVEDVVEASLEIEVVDAASLKPLGTMYGAGEWTGVSMGRVTGLPDTDTIYGLIIHGLSGFNAGGRSYHARWNSVFTRGWVYDGLMDCVKLGCGGWGCSYLCRASGSGVVLKIPLGFEGIIEEEYYEVPSINIRFLQRIKSIAEDLMALDHPGIIKLLGYGVRVPVLVYEYADQGTLAYQLDRGWSPTLRDILAIGLQLSDALRYIHSRGLVHGDIKPSNIFLRDGRVKIGDFSSLTKLLSRTSRHSRLSTCTPGYCAPEQVYRDLKREAVRRGVENRIDVYQLGNVLLELLTGETIDGGEIDETSIDQLLGPVEDEEVKTLIAAMLEPEPWNRPSIEEVEKTIYKIYSETVGRRE